MFGRTRGTDVFENGVGYVLVGGQCKRWRMRAPPEPFDTLLRRTVSSMCPTVLQEKSFVALTDCCS